jgi:hypothetical protein
MSYKLFLIGKKAVKILQRFDNSVLVEYVATEKQSSVNPSLIKSINVESKRNEKSNLKSNKNDNKRNNSDPQTRFDF